MLTESHRQPPYKRGSLHHFLRWCHVCVVTSVQQALTTTVCALLVFFTFLGSMLCTGRPRTTGSSSMQSPQRRNWRDNYLQPRNHNAVSAIPPQQWTSGLCDCFADTTNCCEVAWCHYCQLGFQHRKLTLGHSGPDYGIALALCCLDMWVAAGCVAMYTAYEHRKTVRRYWNINPQDCNEDLKGWFCPCCSTCQVYRELSARGYWPEGLCASEPPANTGSAYVELPQPYPMGVNAVLGVVADGASYAQQSVHQQPAHYPDNVPQTGASGKV